MHCPRCMGMMFYQKFYGSNESYWGWRCIYCGEILDQIIIENRGYSKVLTGIHEHLLNQ